MLLQMTISGCTSVMYCNITVHNILSTHRSQVDHDVLLIEGILSSFPLKSFERIDNIRNMAL